MAGNAGGHGGRQGREFAAELQRYQFAWDHAADRTAHGRPIELRASDFGQAPDGTPPSKP